MTHLGLMLVFSLCVASCFGALLRDDPTSQLWLGLRLFGGFVIGGLALGWLLYPLPL